MKAEKTGRPPLAAGEEVTVTVTDMSTSGEGISHIDGYTLFIRDAVIGDTVRAELTMTKKNYGYARVTGMIGPSPDRVVPRCPLSARCGGCLLQSLSYPAQLRYKKAVVENDLKRIGGLSIPVNDVIGMEEPWRYRNKSQYPVGRDTKTKEIVCGFYEGRSHRIIPLNDCLISGECDAAVIKDVLSYMRSSAVEPYDEKSGEGVVRHILVRRGYATGEVMVCLIVNASGQDILPDLKKLVSDLRRDVPGFKSLCLNLNTRRDNVILGDKVVPVSGEPYIFDRIGDLTFRISPLSFYQVNPIQTKKLYDTVRRMAGLTGRETVLDLYCGIGTIGLYLADQAAALYGVEIIPEAVRDAVENAERNHIDNAHFSVGASEDIFKDLPEADVVILDPPRKGCDPSLLEGLIRQAPGRIVYVSCNPATLARDLKILAAGGFAVEEVQPCDMFAHSAHVETVVLLSRNT